MPHSLLPPGAWALLAVLLAAPVLALDSDAQQPLYLEADNAEMDELQAISLYTGQVLVRQGTLEIHADQVTIHHREDRQPRLIIAIGAPVTYRQHLDGEGPPLRAEAQRMEYLTEKDEITLIGQAVVYQGEDTFRNDRIVYDRIHSKVKAGTSVQGSERVRIRIHPGSRPQ